MSRLFGTDGVRGIANKELTPDLAFRLGFAGAEVLTGEKSHKPIILVGSDTRISCGMLESALVAGITSAGADAFLAGVVPTPAIAYLTRKYNCDAGIMISASHNSYEYNGIKFFASTGYKLPDEIEDRIEKAIKEYSENVQRPIADGIGHRIQKSNSARDYAEHLKRRMSVDLSGMKIALDCANGASYHIAPGLFTDLGADVVAIGIEPDGQNINLNCGSTDLERLEQTVRREGCDIGIAFDGDADRMLAIDENGTIVDGDGIIAIIAKGMSDAGILRDDKVCVTVMSNLGLDIFAEQAGITLYKTQVGDRYVLEEMLKSGIVLGGEQSGHIILLEHSTTGDGILSALALLRTLKDSDQRLSEVHSIMKPLPQVLKNAQISNERKQAAMNDEDVKVAIREEEARLKNKGRILVRPSGTEPIIRVMIEGENKREINKMADRIVDLLTSRYGI
ncbi:MAG: phosphoglucosamine mutase [Clostridiaceae bacterium]|jgi:phosphoglucosamine mutase|nr:phosphoglucosamine mutase [Bacillota bacterium]NLN51758.1 phosphoglucosamine mutase [Clostridiaceae bacterium]